LKGTAAIKAKTAGCLETAREGEIQVSETDSRGSVMHMDMSRREEGLLERAPEQE
jgi:hypothetical protein